MKLIKAAITNGQVKTDISENIPIADVIIVGKTKDSDERQGILIMDDDKFIFIDTGIIGKLQLPILDIVINALNQIATSVDASICPQAPSGSLPLETTIIADLQPIIEELETIKNEL